MTTQSTNDRDPSALEEELVAYLDDELDDDARRKLERRLADEPTVRESLRKLTRVWDALETLPRAEVSEQFATTTVEAVVLKEQESEAVPLVDRLRNRRAWWLKRIAGLAACMVVGFLGVVLFWPNPNQQLAADLPILENLDAYRKVGSIEFARLLVEKKAFPVEKGAADVSGTETPVLAPKAALAKVAAMTDGQKSVIAANQKMLQERIDEHERARLLAMRDALRAAPNAAELQRVTLAYYGWLNTLRSEQQTYLNSRTNPQERYDLMQKMMAADLPDEDHKVVWDWINDYASRHEDDFSNDDGAEQKKFEGPPRVRNIREGVQHWQAMQAILRGMDDGHENEFPFSAYDFKDLEQRLSEKSRERLRECEDPDPAKRSGPVVLELKKLLLAEWLRNMRREHLDRPFKMFNARGDAQTDYAKLLGPDGLSPEDKVRIFLMPPDEAQKELAKEWYIRFGQKAFGGPGFGPPPGPPPDDEGGPPEERRGPRGGGRGDREKNDRHRGDNDPGQNGPSTFGATPP